MLIATRVKQHVRIPPTFLPTELHTLQVIVKHFAHVIAAKALRLHFFVFVHLAFGYFAIVELIPLLFAGGWVSAKYTTKINMSLKRLG